MTRSSLNVAFALLAIAVTAWIDARTDAWPTMAPVHAVAVVFVARSGGRRWGLAAALSAGVAGVIAGWYSASHAALRPPAWTAWDAGARTLAFAYVAVIVAGLEQAAAETRVLRGVLPMCAWCRTVRDEGDGRWKSVEHFLHDRTDAHVSHGICPSCAARLSAERA